VPDAVGVPLIVMELDAHVAETPVGNPLAPDTPLFDIPVAPVVTIVITGDIAVLLHNVGDDEGVPTVLLGVIVIVPVAFTLLQPPVKGIL